MKVHCEVWIATALLHCELPGREGFSRDEILQRACKLHPDMPCRPGVGIHISQHCIANKKPNPNDYRMLYRREDRTFRLFRRGDAYHPQRANGRITPRLEDIPARYLSLLDWYRSEYDTTSGSGSSRDPDDDPLLQLVGLGKDVWERLGGGDAVIRWLRSDTPTTPPWEAGEAKAENDKRQE